jgi:hypothetical protein
VFVKLFGHQDGGLVDTIYVELPAKVRTVLDDLKRSGKLQCVGCKSVLSRSDLRYTFSQFSVDGLKLSYHVVCDVCVKPLLDAIHGVLHGAQQTRSSKEKAAATVGAGGGP